MDTQDLVREGEESSDDEVSFGQTPSTQELERSALDRHSFIFKHDLTSASPDLREFHPLPSQIPSQYGIKEEERKTAVVVFGSTHPPQNRDVSVAMCQRLTGWLESGILKV